MSSEPNTSAWLIHPEWRLNVIDERLVASAGVDEVYVVDEAPAALADRITQACIQGRAHELAADIQCGAAVRALRRLGVLMPAAALQATQRPHATLHWAGNPWPEFAEELRRYGWTLEELLQSDSENRHPPSLQLLVRTDATWTRLLTAYETQPPRGPHLLIDLAYHHTVCIGPLVIPGETACIACLGHRLLRRWGDLAPPTQPAIRQRVSGIAAWLADAGVLGLRCVERTMSLDLREFRLQQATVFAMPGCPVCATFPPRLDNAALSAGSDGSLILPWLS